MVVTDKMTFVQILYVQERFHFKCVTFSGISSSMCMFHEVDVYAVGTLRVFSVC